MVPDDDLDALVPDDVLNDLDALVPDGVLNDLDALVPDDVLNDLDDLCVLNFVKFCSESFSRRTLREAEVYFF